MLRRLGNWLPIVLVVAALALLFHFRSHLHFGAPAIEDAKPGEFIFEDHFSPPEDLEHLDLYRLEHARLSMDIAMYSFTDKPLADELIKLAHDGVEIRIYRDREQYDTEQRNAAQHHDQSTTDMFRGEQNIQVRVKASGRRDLMHLKAYLIDGTLLRDGSANWSPAGEKTQDNNARFTNNPIEIRFFNDDFEQMWARSDNEVVQ
ncbi:MAG TPA: phospholipase D-like domain-containing protein [Terriglobales bacterium]|jgi:phosphatidylserine/phosphatidylglycerophosphate/cardiolipin synthase-like enzyme|nr:phospholipase D-like domain-containing protein [Terriglobales bacterium]